MADFMLVQQLSQGVTDHYFEKLRDAESNRVNERSACVKIQRAYRRHTQRKYDNFMGRQATDIQRVFRGWRGRKRHKDAVRTRQLQRDQQFFAAMAVLIQKCVRGWLSRRNRQDCRARRKYLDTASQRGTELQQHLHAKAMEQTQRTQAVQDTKLEKEFNGLAASMHHLLGTKTVPGVFGSPFGPEFHRTAFQLPMEEHIKDAFSQWRAEQKMQEGMRLARPRNERTQQHQQEFSAQYTVTTKQQQRSVPQRTVQRDEFDSKEQPPQQQPSSAAKLRARAPAASPAKTPAASAVPAVPQPVQGNSRLATASKHKQQQTPAAAGGQQVLRHSAGKTRGALVLSSTF